MRARSSGDQFQELKALTDEGQRLRARGDGHDEAGDGRAAEVDPPSLGQQHHPLAVRPDDVVDLKRSNIGHFTSLCVFDGSVAIL